MNPIETMFHDTFLDILDNDYFFSVFDGENIKIADCKIQKEYNAPSRMNCIFSTFPIEYRNICFNLGLEDQVSYGPYVVDFIFTAIGAYKRYVLAIEIDGHEWHEKNKEQAAMDKRRGRALVSMGISCLRFTGSEIYRDSKSCIDEILKILVMSIYHEITDHNEYYSMMLGVQK
jgi:very-short-patch-repair endonuclease